VIIPQWLFLIAIAIVAFALVMGLIASFWPRHGSSNRIRSRHAPASPGRPLSAGESPRVGQSAPRVPARPSISPVVADPPPPTRKPSAKLPPPPEFFGPDRGSSVSKPDRGGHAGQEPTPPPERAPGTLPPGPEFFVTSAPTNAEPQIEARHTREWTPPPAPVPPDSLLRSEEAMPQAPEIARPASPELPVENEWTRPRTELESSAALPTSMPPESPGSAHPTEVPPPVETTAPATEHTPPPRSVEPLELTPSGPPAETERPRPRTEGVAPQPPPPQVGPSRARESFASGEGPRQPDTGALTQRLHEFRRLSEAKRYQELLAKSQPELSRLAGEAASSNLEGQATLASLYSLVGSAKQAMGDDEGAKEAFREAVHWAPAHERQTYQHQLASLAAIVGRRFLHQAERTREEEETERIQALRQAIVWLREGVSVRPDDAELSSGLERARRGLLATYGHVATAMMERQELHGARRLLREALTEEQIPTERREVFLDLIASTFAGEIGILAADAVRALEAGQEHEAVVLFQRAEKVLSSVPDDAISAGRRDEINRRFWWGYTKLGIRRLQNGHADAAIDPLLRAVKIPGIDADRQQQTREALIDACRDLLEHRNQTMRDLISQGRTADAQLEGDRLRGILEDGIRYGIRPEEFGSGFDHFKDLMLRLGLPVG